MGQAVYVLTSRRLLPQTPPPQVTLLSEKPFRDDRNPEHSKVSTKLGAVPRYSSLRKSGARVDDLYEVCGQVWKSTMRRPSDLRAFFKTLDDRALR